MREKKIMATLIWILGLFCFDLFGREGCSFVVCLFVGWFGLVLVWLGLGFDC